MGNCSQSAGLVSFRCDLTMNPCKIGKAIKDDDTPIYCRLVVTPHPLSRCFVIEYQLYEVGVEVRVVYIKYT